MNRIVLTVLSWVASSPIVEIAKAWLLKQMLRVSALGLIPWVLLRQSPAYVHDYLSSAYFDGLNFLSYYVPVPEVLFHTRPETIIKISVWLLVVYGASLVLLSLLRRFNRLIQSIIRIIEGKKR
jgi:hypothetical protein